LKIWIGHLSISLKQLVGDRVFLKEDGGLESVHHYSLLQHLHAPTQDKDQSTEFPHAALLAQSDRLVNGESRH
jgi:hypothetical protein